MVSGAPRSRLYEIDNSEYWTEESGLGVYMGLVADAGPLGINRCTTIGELKAKYTKDGKITASHGIDYQVAKRIAGTVGLELFIGRVCCGNALYGGCVVPCGTTSPTYALTTGLANPEDISFDLGEEETCEQAVFRFTDDVLGSYGGTAFYLPGRKHAMSFAIAAENEVDVIYPSIDDYEALNGTFFRLPADAGYVWFSLDDAGTDPGISTKSIKDLYTAGKGRKVVITSESSVDSLKDAIIRACSDLSGVTVTASTKQARTCIRMFVTEPGFVNPGSQGSTGWIFERESQGAEEIPFYPDSYITTTTREESIKRTIVIDLERNELKDAIVSKILAKLEEYPEYLFGPDYVTETDELGNEHVVSALINISLKTPGPAENAAVNESYPAPVTISTEVQGSMASGTGAVFFYYNNPSDKTNNYGIKIYNSEDYPQKAPAGTFLVEVYEKSNTRVPVSTALCSRDKNKTDDYNRSMYVEDVLARITDIRAINNTELSAKELPRSTRDANKVEYIQWFGGGATGTFNSANNELLNEYIKTCSVDDGDARHSDLRDKEAYAVSLLLPSGFYAPSYLQTLDKIAQDRGEACHICGCPLDYETSVTYERALERWVNEEAMLTSSYSAMFSPHMYAYDDDNGRTYALPVETCVAEQIAFANENYSIAEPILGFARGTLQGVTGIARRYTFTDDGKGTGDHLYDNRINPIRFFKNQGYVIWGQKTQQRTASKRDRLNVRLMLISLKPLLNQIQMNTIGELPTQAAKKRLEGQLRTVLNVGVGRNWFKPNYNLIIEDDPVYEQQHIQRIFYEIEPYDAIEYVQGYIVITNGTVSEITQMA